MAADTGTQNSEWKKRESFSSAMVQIVIVAVVLALVVFLVYRRGNTKKEIGELMKEARTTAFRGNPADLRKAIEFGHAMATRDIGAFFRAAMKFATAPTVFSLSGRFWRTYFDFGSLVMTTKNPPTADAELRDWPLMAEVAYYELAGSFVAWLEASKASNVRLSRLELTSASVLSLRLEWS